MKKATIFDYVRMCKANNSLEKCLKCPLHEDNNGEQSDCDEFVKNFTDKANEIILNWCEEHPIKTRQSEFLKMFPNVVLINNEVIKICPDIIDSQYGADCTRLTCDECHKKYWLAEVDEHDK